MKKSVIFIQPWQWRLHPAGCTYTLTVSLTRVKFSCCWLKLRIKRFDKLCWWNSSHILLVWVQSMASVLWEHLLWRSRSPDRDICQRSPGGCCSAIMHLCITNQLSQRLKGTYLWLTSAKSTRCIINIKYLMNNVTVILKSANSTRF